MFEPHLFSPAEKPRRGPPEGYICGISLNWALGKGRFLTYPFDHYMEQGKTLTLGIFDQELGIQSFSSPQQTAKGVASNHTHHPGEHPKSWVTTKLMRENT